MNPQDILGVNPGGAVKSPDDSRDYKWIEVGFSSEPFDWTKGYDIEDELGVTIPIKNQGISGSCGGQSEAYLGASISTYHDKTYEEKSAKFSYAPVAVRPGGGSSGRDLAARACNVGWGSEALTSSYENGLPPSEMFMERTQDITQDAINHASKDKALSYVLLPLDIDEVAKATRDFKGVRIGITGSNNGTWLTARPNAPKDGETHWYHWITIQKAKLIEGKKYIGFPNSWGVKVGDNGWQWLSEDWFNKQLTTDYYGSIPLWEPRCYIWNEQTPLPTFTHFFTRPMSYGYRGDEVKALQTALQLDGCFPVSVPITGNYLEITRQSVLKFQKKYQVASNAELDMLQGRVVGPATRAQLNKLFYR